VVHITSPTWFRVDAPVVNQRCIYQNEYEIVLYEPQIALHARPGQFVMALSGEEETTECRRPFSLFRADKMTGYISILYLARGSFTADLARKRPGDSVTLLGPLGHGFEWKMEPSTHHLVVAGGIGSPPLCFLVRRMREAEPSNATRILAINGARRADLLVGNLEFEEMAVEIKIATEDGSMGRLGQAPDILSDELNPLKNARTVVYACGPMPMLKRVAELCSAANIDCQTSIETPMPCGVGDCGSCNVTVIDPTSESLTSRRLACVDGPVFDAAEIDWSNF